jgi:hypothetical protein
MFKELVLRCRLLRTMADIKGDRPNKPDGDHGIGGEATFASCVSPTMSERKQNAFLPKSLPIEDYHQQRD